MWNRIIGKSDDVKEKSPSQSSRRNIDRQRSTRLRSGSESLASSNTATKLSRGDDRDRGIEAISTRLSSTTGSAYPEPGSTSLASSYAIASDNQDDQSNLSSGLRKNASVADQVPKSMMDRTDRDSLRRQGRKSEQRRERSRSLERKTGRKERKERRNSRERKEKKREKGAKKEIESTIDRGPGRLENGYDDRSETARGDFNNQIESPGFMQFPGQSGAALIAGSTPIATGMSPHVPDQFPGQFPTSSAEPYRPPLAVGEGGPGLAADYYGDAGESVSMQPGVRPQQPTLIVGAEPHLQPASSFAAPPPEPSASGGVGAAASFYDGSFDSGTNQVSQQQRPARPNGPPSSSATVPNNVYQTSSTSALPTLGAAVAGAATGYYMEGQTTSHAQKPSSAVGGQSYTDDRPDSYVDAASNATSIYTQPSKPGKHSSHQSNVPLYAAGSAGLAAAAYHYGHTNSQSSSHQFANGSMAQQHRHSGPLAKFVDFFRDPEGVAQFEEYTEYIGVCRDCFAPGSTARDAPRKHYYRQRRSSERLGSSARIDKDSRYWSSDSERRRRKEKSWLQASIGGYGLAKLGETLFKENHDFDDTYSVKSGRKKKSSHSASPDRKSRTSRGTTRRSSEAKSRRHSSSGGHIETGITSDGRVYRKNPSGGISGSPVITTFGVRRQSKSRSRSPSTSRKAAQSEIALGAAVGSSVAASDARHRMSHPEVTSIRRNQRESERNQERHRKSTKDKTHLAFGQSSSSSSDLDVAPSARRDRRSGRKRRNSKDDHRKAELAVVGLGAAAAALALTESRHDSRSKRRGDLVAVKESKGKHDAIRKKDERSHIHLEDDGWESASEDDESVSSGLAYGSSNRRKGSRSSLSSDSSGTDKWGWRWGNKKTSRRSTQARHASADDQGPRITMHSNSSLPLQNVYSDPATGLTRFGMEAQGLTEEPSRPIVAARPEPVPIQHPQPVVAVSPAVYSAQAPSEYSYGASVERPVFAEPPSQGKPPVTIPRSSTDYAFAPSQMPGSFPEISQPAPDPSIRGSKPRRRDSSPAAYTRSGPQSSELDLKSSLPATSSAVRFELSEEQVERDRRGSHWHAEEDDQRRRRQKRRESEDYQRFEQSTASSMEQRRRESEAKRELDERPARTEGRIESQPSSGKKISWALPAAAGGIASVVEVAVKSHKEESETPDEDVGRRERRRRRREERERFGNGVNYQAGESDRKTRASAQEPEMSVWQVVAKRNKSPSHEDYKDFFTPIELLSKDPQYKQAVAEADVDHAITAYEVPDVVTIESSGFHDSREAPAYTFGPDGEEIDPSPTAPPWVPKLKLIAPTPQPSIEGSETGEISPLGGSRDTVGDVIVEQPTPITTFEPLVGDGQTPEYTVIEPRGSRNQTVEPDFIEEVTSGDDHTPKYTVIEPRDSRSRTVEPHPSEEMESSDPSARGGPTSGSWAPADFNEPRSSKSTREYDDDPVFAATLAAGLQEAGFDPAIVVDNPTFRRRQSPPGSEDPSTHSRPLTESMINLPMENPENERDVLPPQGFVEGEIEDEYPERTIPGAFEEEPEDLMSEPERKLGKKKKKRRDKGSKRQALYNALDQKDNDAHNREANNSIAEPQPSQIERRSPFTDSGEHPRDRSSLAATAPLSNEHSSARDLEEISSHVSRRNDDPESVVLAPNRPTSAENTADPGLDHQAIPSGLPGKSVESIAEAKTAEENDAATGVMDNFPTPKKRKSKVKGRKSARESKDPFTAETTLSVDEHDIAEQSQPSIKDEERRNDDRATRKLGRTTQEQPATESTPAPTGQAPSVPSTDWLTNPEDHGDDRRIGVVEPTIGHEPPVYVPELEQGVEEKPTFTLGIGQKTPSSPDTSTGVDFSATGLLDRPSSSPLTAEHEPRSSSGPASLPASPTRTAEAQARRLSHLQQEVTGQSPLSSSSPTAIPFHFRMPPPSPGVARSLPSVPQTPSTADSPASRSKPRPRSIEYFRSSSEIRPLWLVERHGSKQELTSEERYPSLPSSHTTSRSSSVRDPEEIESTTAEFLDATDYHEVYDQRDHGLLIDTSGQGTKSETGLLDSQQPTPTAASFSAALKTFNEPVDDASDVRSGPAVSPNPFSAERRDDMNRRSSEPSSLPIPTSQEGDRPSLKHLTLGAILGASTAGALIAAKDIARESRDEVTGTEHSQHYEMEEKPNLPQVTPPMKDNDTSKGVIEDYSPADKTASGLVKDTASDSQVRVLDQVEETMSSPRQNQVIPVTAEQQLILEKHAQGPADTWTASAPSQNSGKGKAIENNGSDANKDQYAAQQEVLQPDGPPDSYALQDDGFALEQLALQEAVATRHQSKATSPKSEVQKTVTRAMPLEEVVNVMSTVAEASNDNIGQPPRADQFKDPLHAELEQPATLYEEGTAIDDTRIPLSQFSALRENEDADDSGINAAPRFALEEADKTAVDVRPEQTPMTDPSSQGPRESSAVDRALKRPDQLEEQILLPEEAEKGEMTPPGITFEPPSVVDAEAEAEPQPASIPKDDLKATVRTVAGINRGTQLETNLSAAEDIAPVKKSKKSKKGSRGMPVEDKRDPFKPLTDQQSYQKPVQGPTEHLESASREAQELGPGLDPIGLVLHEAIPLSPRDDPNTLKIRSDNNLADSASLLVPEHLSESSTRQVEEDTDAVGEDSTENPHEELIHSGDETARTGPLSTESPTTSTNDEIAVPIGGQAAEPENKGADELPISRRESGRKGKKNKQKYATVLVSAPSEEQKPAVLDATIESAAKPRSPQEYAPASQEQVADELPVFQKDMEKEAEQQRISTQGTEPQPSEGMIPPRADVGPSDYPAHIQKPETVKPIEAESFPMGSGGTEAGVVKHTPVLESPEVSHMEPAPSQDGSADAESETLNPRIDMAYEGGSLQIDADELEEKSSIEAAEPTTEPVQLPTKEVSPSPILEDQLAKGPDIGDRISKGSIGPISATQNSSVDAVGTKPDEKIWKPHTPTEQVKNARSGELLEVAIQTPLPVEPFNEPVAQPLPIANTDATKAVSENLGSKAEEVETRAIGASASPVQVDFATSHQENKDTTEKETGQGFATEFEKDRPGDKVLVSQSLATESDIAPLSGPSVAVTDTARDIKAMLESSPSGTPAETSEQMGQSLNESLSLPPSTQEPVDKAAEDADLDWDLSKKETKRGRESQSLATKDAQIVKFSDQAPPPTTTEPHRVEESTQAEIKGVPISQPSKEESVPIEEPVHRASSAEINEDGTTTELAQVPVTPTEAEDELLGYVAKSSPIHENLEPLAWKESTEPITVATAEPRFEPAIDGRPADRVEPLPTTEVNLTAPSLHKDQDKALPRDSDYAAPAPSKDISPPDLDGATKDITPEEKVADHGAQNFEPELNPLPLTTLDRQDVDRTKDGGSSVPKGESSSSEKGPAVSALGHTDVIDQPQLLPIDEEKFRTPAKSKKDKRKGKKNRAIPWEEDTNSQVPKDATLSEDIGTGQDQSATPVSAAEHMYEKAEDGDLASIPKSKKDKKKSKKKKVLAWEDDETTTPAPPTEFAEGSKSAETEHESGTIQGDALAAPQEPVTEVAENPVDDYGNVPRSKKSKKAKKSKDTSWADEYKLPAVGEESVDASELQEGSDPTEMKGYIKEQSQGQVSTSPNEALETLETQKKSTKDKKKDKKSKRLMWADVPDEAVVDTEATTPSERRAEIEELTYEGAPDVQQENQFTESATDVIKSVENAPRTKKDKKKAKKFIESRGTDEPEKAKFEARDSAFAESKDEVDNIVPEHSPAELSAVPPTEPAKQAKEIFESASKSKEETETTEPGVTASTDNSQTILPEAGNLDQLSFETNIHPQTAAFEQPTVEAEERQLFSNRDEPIDTTYSDHLEQPSSMPEVPESVNPSKGHLEEEKPPQLEKLDLTAFEPNQASHRPTTALEITGPEQQPALESTNLEANSTATGPPSTMSRELPVQIPTSVDETSLPSLPEDLNPLRNVSHGEEATEHPALTTAPTSHQAHGEESMSDVSAPEGELDTSYSPKKSKKAKKKPQKAKALDIEDELDESAPRVIDEPFVDEAVHEHIPQVNETSSKVSNIEGDATAIPNIPETRKMASEQRSEIVAAIDRPPELVSPELVHKRAFSEEAGPEISLEEEEAMEPPSKTTRTDESSPPSQTIVEMEEDAFLMPAKTNKKSKISKSGAFSGLGTFHAQSPITESKLSSSPPSSAVETKADAAVFPQQVQSERLFEEPAILDPNLTPTGALGEPIQRSPAPAQVRGSVMGTAGEDDAWNDPVRKRKKDKKKRKASVRIQSDPEIVEAQPSFTPTPNERAAPTFVEEAKLSEIRSPIGESHEMPDSEVLPGRTLTSGPTSTENFTANEEMVDPSFSETQNREPGVGEEALQDSKEQRAENSAIPEDDAANTLAAVKKSKKGKKGKKRQQPVIWEDQTATGPAFSETDRYANDPATPLQQTEPSSSEGYFQLDHLSEEYTKQVPESPSAAAINSPDRDERQLSFTNIPKMVSADRIETQPSSHDGRTESEPIAWKDVPYESVIQESDQVAQGPITSTREVSFIGSHSPEVPLTEQERVEKGPVPQDRHAEPEWNLPSTKKRKKGKKWVQQATGSETPNAAIPTETDKPDDSSTNGAESKSATQTVEVEGGVAGAKGEIGTPKTITAAGTLGAAAALATNLGRDLPNGAKTEKPTERQGFADQEAGDIREVPLSELSRSSENIEQPYQQEFEPTPPRSPLLENLGQTQANAQSDSVQLNEPTNRDSAVHISDPPVVSGTMPVHRPIRDSGYQGTEASPVVDQGLEYAETDLDRRPDLDPFSAQRHESHDPSDTEWEAQQSRTSARSPHNVSMSVESERDALPILTPERSSPSRTTSPPDESHRPEKLQTAHPTQDEHQEPSPAISTSKDRSSALFQSPPSTREEPMNQPDQQPARPQAQFPLIEERTTSPAARSPSIEAHRAPHQSLFGGSAGFTSDALSPPMSPVARDGSPNGRLDTIRESSPEESPLRKKDRRPSSDTGSPERGIKSRRRTGSSQRQVRSPPILGPSRQETISTDDMISRLPWPAVDEDQHSVELERSRSRTTDRQASRRPSVVSTSGMPPKVPESEVRSFSGASIRSGESINAIIRTPPDQVRSASGLSYRSGTGTGTPPLRRVDRSLSGDLREANRKSDAKKRAKAEAEVPAIAIASSSTYDPTEDKGKTKVREMADVYVSYHCVHLIITVVAKSTSTGGLG